MSKPQFNVQDLTLEQFTYLYEKGDIEVNGTSVPARSKARNKAKATPAPARKAKATARAKFGAYGTYVKGDEFSNLHPVIRRGKKGLPGSLEVKAMLNMCVVTGKCELSTAAYSALPSVMYVNGLAAKSNKRDGKVVSRFYAAAPTKDGTPHGSTTSFFLDGGRVRVDHSARTLELVPDNGQEFAAESVAAISAVVESLS